MGERGTDKTPYDKALYDKSPATTNPLSVP